MVATAKRADGIRATLLTRLSTVVALAESSTRLRTYRRGYACAAWVHLPYKEGRSRAEEYLGRARIDIAGPMQVNRLAEGKYIVTTTLVGCTHD